MYNPSGDLETSIPASGGFVGPDGYLYAPSEDSNGPSIHLVINREGSTVDTLATSSEMDVQSSGFYRRGQLNVSSDKSKLFTGHIEPSLGEQVFKEKYEMHQVTVDIERVSRKARTISSVGTVRLPSKRVYRSGLPVSMPAGIPFWYPEELVTIQGDTLYALGFSLPRPDAEEEAQYHLVKVNLREYFWHETHHGPDYLKKYTALHAKSDDELRLLRNEIFARYGYTFSSSALQQHFEDTDWYEPDPDFSADRLSEEETWLARRIKELEEVKRDEALEAEDTE